jgi:hypothetical protein
MDLSANRRLILRIGSAPKARTYLFLGILPLCKKDLLFNIEGVTNFYEFIKTKSLLPSLYKREESPSLKKRG